jgi:hypothetical protein
MHDYKSLLTFSKFHCLIAKNALDSLKRTFALHINKIKFLSWLEIRSVSSRYIF